VEKVLSYEVASSTEWGPPFVEWAFNPTVFVDISSTLEAKLVAIEAYQETFQSEVRPFPHRVHQKPSGYTPKVEG
jgi:LmbE family N-acetylglucosaminyl deacetylase